VPVRIAFRTSKNVGARIVLQDDAQIIIAPPVSMRTH